MKGTGCLQNAKSIVPNFLVAGAAKCGTTSLYQYIKQHPEVYMSNIKEPDFFFSQFAVIPTAGIGDHHQQVVQHFSDYCSLFSGASGMKAVGEASHTNFYHYRKTIPLIKRYLGDPKIVIMLRNPVERAFSTHASLVLQGREYLTFEEALRQETWRRENNWRPLWFFKDMGFYTSPVQEFLEQFKDVKICLFDDLKRDPAALLRDIYAFLEVDPSFVPDTSVAYNVSGVAKLRILKGLFKKQPGPLLKFARGMGVALLSEDGWTRFRERQKARLVAKPVMKPETRKQLTEDYREDIRELQALIGRDLTHWVDR